MKRQKTVVINGPMVREWLGSNKGTRKVREERRRVRDRRRKEEEGEGEG